MNKNGANIGTKISILPESPLGSGMHVYLREIQCLQLNAKSLEIWYNLKTEKETVLAASTF